MIRVLPEEPNSSSIAPTFLIDLAETTPDSIGLFKSRSAGCIYWVSGLSRRNAEPWYTEFALSDLVVSGALPPEGNSALHRFPQAPTA
jgi:hypothetical protein